VRNIYLIEQREYLCHEGALAGTYPLVLVELTAGEARRLAAISGRPGWVPKLVEDAAYYKDYGSAEINGDVLREAGPRFRAVKASARRSGASFMVGTASRLLHTVTCQYMRHPSRVTDAYHVGCGPDHTRTMPLDETALPVYFTEAEARAWLAAGWTRKPCQVCKPAVKGDTGEAV